MVRKIVQVLAKATTPSNVTSQDFPAPLKKLSSPAEPLVIPASDFGLERQVSSRQLQDTIQRRLPYHRKRQRRVWTLPEIQALKEGLVKFGCHWSAIVQEYGPQGDKRLSRWSTVDLKDKARNERNRRDRQGIDLGIWRLATFYPEYNFETGQGKQRDGPGTVARDVVGAQKSPRPEQRQQGRIGI